MSPEGVPTLEHWNEVWVKKLLNMEILRSAAHSTSLRAGFQNDMASKLS